MIPCGLKKRTILIVIGMKTSILKQFWIGSRYSEKGEVLLFSVHRREAEMHRGEVSCSVTQTSSRARRRSEIFWHSALCSIDEGTLSLSREETETHSLITSKWMSVQCAGILHALLHVQVIWSLAITVIVCFSWTLIDINPLYLWYFSSLL